MPFRAYRFPHRNGGRLSRRPGSIGTLGPLAGGLAGFLLAMCAMGGVAAAAASALGPGVLWRDHMKTVVGGLPVVWYPKPSGIVDATVCTNAWL